MALVGVLVGHHFRYIDLISHLFRLYLVVNPGIEAIEPGVQTPAPQTLKPQHRNSSG